MVFIQLERHGDSVTAADMVVVPGRARLPRFPDRIAPEGKWVCEIRDAAGTVVWSRAIPDPFAKPRHRISADDAGPDSLVALRIPYRPGFAHASFHRVHRRAGLPKQGPLAAGEAVAPEGEEVQSAFLNLDLAAARKGD